MPGGELEAMPPELQEAIDTVLKEQGIVGERANRISKLLENCLSDNFDDTDVDAVIRLFEPFDAGSVSAGGAGVPEEHDEA